MSSMVLRRGGGGGLLLLQCAQCAAVVLIAKSRSWERGHRVWMYAVSPAIYSFAYQVYLYFPLMFGKLTLL